MCMCFLALLVLTKLSFPHCFEESRLLCVKVTSKLGSSLRSLFLFHSCLYLSPYQCVLFVLQWPFPTFQCHITVTLSLPLPFLFYFKTDLALHGLFLPFIYNFVVPTQFIESGSF